MGWQSRTSADEAGDWNKSDWFGLPAPVEEPKDMQRTASTDEKPKRHEGTTVSKHVVAEGQDWLNTDFFSPKAIAPSKRRRAPSPIPDTRLLFQVQDDLMKVMTEFNKMPSPTDDNDDYAKQYKKVKTAIENGYRLINRYLRTYVNNEVR